MEFTVMNKDTAVARITVTDDKKEAKIEKYIPDGISQPFSGEYFNIFRLYNFLKSRCYEDGRADLQEILKKAGMKNNNPWEWIKISHGVTYDDFLWIKFPGEKLMWKDVKLR